MKLYYRAVTKDGKLVQGFIEAKDINQAAGYLRNKEFIPIHISQRGKNKFLEIIPIFSSRVKAGDIVIFTRQLSAMLSAGLTLMRSLDVLKNQISSDAMGEIIDGIISDIEEGMSFSSSISKYPKVFSQIYVSIIKSSESSGLLDKALLRLADNLEKQQKLKNTIKAALLYPIIVVIAMVGVVAIMMVFVIPTLSTVYKSLDISLPLPTQIVVSISNFSVLFWPVFVPLPILLWFSYRRLRNTVGGQLIIDNLLLRLPIFGNITKKTILTEFSRTFGLLVGSGTLVVQSLMQVSDITGNIHYKNAIVDISKKVEKGITVGDAMSIYDLFPPVLIQLTKVGEQTGKLDETLLKASEYFEEEVNLAVKNLTTAMEPFIIVALGIGVGFLMIAIITPIYSLIPAIGK